jgi:hypothetical protein
LTHDGLALTDWLLLRVEGDIFVTGVWTPERGFIACVIKDDDLPDACKDYLKSIGARRLDSLEEIAMTARRERWPDWGMHTRGE